LLQDWPRPLSQQPAKWDLYINPVLVWPAIDQELHSQLVTNKQAFLWYGMVY